MARVIERLLFSGTLTWKMPKQRLGLCEMLTPFAAAYFMMGMPIPPCCARS